MRVLVVGAGIAGLGFALAAARSGHDLVVIERHPGLRSEGYMIDFFGPGFDAAERLDLLGALERIHYPVERLEFADREGKVHATLDYPRMRQKIFRGRHFNFLRGDLERALHDALPPGVDLRYGVTARSIVDDGGSVRVETSDGVEERFDLVVGADGVRSHVREATLPQEDVRIVSLGVRTAAYLLHGRPDALPLDTFRTVTVPDACAAAYPIRGGRSATFFAYRVDGPVDHRSPERCRQELESRFRGLGALVDPLLDAFPADGDVYFDEVVQVETQRFSRGRVALLGDACGAVSLVAGQGASMALAGAYVLANELDGARTNDGRTAAGTSPRSATEAIEGAFARYEARIRPAIEARQRAGRRNRSWFLPRSRFSVRLRDGLTSWIVDSPFAALLGRSIGGKAISLD